MKPPRVASCLDLNDIRHLGHPARVPSRHMPQVQQMPTTTTRTVMAPTMERIIPNMELLLSSTLIVAGGAAVVVGVVVVVVVVVVEVEVSQPKNKLHFFYDKTVNI